MLGARARAAEYNAFKAATARQASREAEEQKLPPKPIPVSLGAFTKSTQMNRNKGNKSWVPLILDDTIGEEIRSGDNVLETTPPIPSQVEPDDDQNALTDSNSSTSGTISKKIRVNIPEIAIPTGPKNMFMAMNPIYARDTTTLEDLHRNIDSANCRSSAEEKFYNGGHNRSLNDPQNEPVTGDRPIFGICMNPDDISPSKQEQKFATISHGYENSTSLLHDSKSINPLRGAVMNTAALTPVQEHNIRQSPEEELPLSLNQGSIKILRRPEGRIVLSNINLSRLFNLQAANNLTFKNRSTFGSPSTFVGHTSESYPLARVGSSWDTAPHQRIVQSEEQSRNNKHQNFVAAQQALAKTGKTVLHNPTIHQTISVEKDSADVIELGTETGNNQVEALKGINQIHIASCQSQIGGSNEKNITKLKDVASPPTLYETPGINFENWLELHPTRLSERKKMQVLMRNVALQRGLEAATRLYCKDGQRRDIEAFNWIRGGARASQEVRQRIERFCLEYMTNLSYSGSPADTEDLNCKDGTKLTVWRASLIAAGHVLGSILAYQDQQRQSTAEMDYFCKFKPPPEFAVEKNGPLGKKPGSQSFFEGDEIGFHKVPVRIARDPRFQPQERNETKSQMEDEWCDRHGSYRRQRLV